MSCLQSQGGDGIKIGVGEGNGNPLQYTCLENPMDGGAWWATVHGVAKIGVNQHGELEEAR